ncbi:MAG: hypothetical protein R3D44_16155 [Hyphomicrobiaceae bacterium]
MLKSVLMSGAILLLGVATAAAQTAGTTGSAGSKAGGQQMTQAECQAIWSKADASSAGSLTETQAQPYVTNFKSADTNGDKKLSSAEFLAACQHGMAKSTATTGAGSGTSGSTSGTKK